MVTRHERLSEFNESIPPEGEPLQLLCEDHSGTYIIPFACERRDGAWYRIGIIKLIDANVIGWRRSRPKANLIENVIARDVERDPRGYWRETISSALRDGRLFAFRLGTARLRPNPDSAHPAFERRIVCTLTYLTPTRLSSRQTASQSRWVVLPMMRRVKWSGSSASELTHAPSGV